MSDKFKKQPDIDLTESDDCCKRNELDLINRRDAIDALEEQLDYLQMLNKDDNPTAESNWYGVNWARNTIADLPSAEPEIIRCKDCKHRPEIRLGCEECYDGFDIKFPDDICPCQCDDGWYNWMPKDDFYCSRAERKTEEHQ